MLVTRGLVRRIKRLVKATASFAEGDYNQRVPVEKHDEVGLLEERFNQMTQQLVESMQKEQELIEKNTRLEERARIEQELQTASQIQHSLLPKTVPHLAGWQLATYYQPAREVGGDLYDFLAFADGRLGLVIGDVTDKGVPAAMVMASTRSMLRAAALASDSPGEVLARVNNLLYADTPERMFVTCFYAILEPASGKLRYANAGHDLPYQRNRGGVVELLATGMPLGLMPDMFYEERETCIDLGDSLLLYSDGLVEAHSPTHEMFSFPRLKTLLASSNRQADLIDHLLTDLRDFTGTGWEQEDDVTLVTLARASEPAR
jgi:serine phosphatase RsbU (regulator of sigma subunit)